MTRKALKSLIFIVSFLVLSACTDQTISTTGSGTFGAGLFGSLGEPNASVSDSDTDSSNNDSNTSGNNAKTTRSDRNKTSTSDYAYHTDNSEIYKNGERIALIGINWFGFETTDYVFHGLWERNYLDQLDDIQELGFNALRIPFCPGTLNENSPNSNTWNNPTLEGLNSLEVFDHMLEEINSREIYMLLDHHRPDCGSISELWYIDSYSEEEWIDDLAFVAERYDDLEYFIGIDLKNEPHGVATWGTGDEATDWNTAAEKAAEAILEVNDNILIFVEGIQDDSNCSSTDWDHWWGGNLEPIQCHPLDIPSDKLVLSPHVYGPDVYSQDYFNKGEDFSHMPEIWDTHFGFAQDDGYTLAIGEFGGKYGEHMSNDDDWQDEFVDYLIDREICYFFFWSWNPNSGDTGGIVGDDWETVQTDKYNNLKRLMDFCSG